MKAPGPVVFFGTPQFAVPSLEHLAHSAFRPGLVVSQPSRPVGRGRKITPPPVAVRAAELGIRCVQIEKVNAASFLDALEELRPWVGVVVAFGQIFPRRLLDIPTEGCVNVHASLLPEYRGAAPIQAAIAAGDEHTGVTTMRMESGLDSGPLLLKSQLAIGADETAPELSTRLASAGAELIVETLKRLAAGDLEAVAQDESQVTWAPRLEKSDGIVDWSSTAAEIYNRYRAFKPWPGLSASFRGRPIKIADCRPVVARESATDAEAGTVVSTATELVVACGRGTRLALLSLQRPGRRAVSGLEFANGERVELGECFQTP